MFITIQKSLQLYYKQKLLAQELENTKKDLEAKTKEIEKQVQENCIKPSEDSLKNSSIETYVKVEPLALFKGDKFVTWTDKDVSKVKHFGLEYVGKRSNIERNDLKKIKVSKLSYIVLILCLALIIYCIL